MMADLTRLSSNILEESRIEKAGQFAPSRKTSPTLKISLLTVMERLGINTQTISELCDSTLLLRVFDATAPAWSESDLIDLAAFVRTILFSSTSSILNYHTHLRNVMRRHKMDITKLPYPKDLSDIKKKENGKQLEKKMRDPVTIEFNWTNDLVPCLLSDAGFVPRLLGVCLAVGCRSAEVVAPTVMFESIPVKAESKLIKQLGSVQGDEEADEEAEDLQRLLQKGSVKVHRNATGPAHIVKPIVGSNATVAQVLDVIKSLREDYSLVAGDDPNPARFNQLFGGQISRAMARMFPEQAQRFARNGMGFGANFLRSCYVNLAWKSFGKQAGCTKTRFAMDVLGHGNSTAAAAHYQCVNVVVLKVKAPRTKPRGTPGPKSRKASRLSRTASALTGKRYLTELVDSDEEEQPPLTQKTSLADPDETSSDSGSDSDSSVDSMLGPTTTHTGSDGTQSGQGLCETGSSGDTGHSATAGKSGSSHQRARHRARTASSGEPEKKKRKRAEPSATVIINGITLEKVPYIRRARAEQNAGRLEMAKRRLTEAGMPLTRFNIWRMGVSTQLTIAMPPPSIVAKEASIDEVI